VNIEKDKRQNRLKLYQEGKPYREVQAKKLEHEP
jgi:hypothetical protein